LSRLLRYANNTPTIAHILTHSVNLAFGSKSGFENKCQVRACDFGLGPSSSFKMRPVYNSTSPNMHSTAP